MGKTDAPGRSVCSLRAEETWPVQEPMEMRPLQPQERRDERRLSSASLPSCSMWKGGVTFHVERQTAKTCSSGCGRPRDVGYDTRCRLCRNADKNAARLKHADLTPEARARANCRSYTHVLIARGVLVPQPCENCGATKRIEAHHDDYTKPREVRWKCHDCHREHHRRLNAACGGDMCATCRTAPKRSGGANCLTCHAAWMRTHRPSHSEMTAEQRARANCRAYTRMLIARGHVTRKPCEDCGDPAGPEVRPRHDDYSKPRQISRWTCDRCERERRHHNDQAKAS